MAQINIFDPHFEALCSVAASRCKLLRVANSLLTRTVEFTPVQLASPGPHGPVLPIIIFEFPSFPLVLNDFETFNEIAIRNPVIAYNVSHVLLGDAKVRSR